VGALADPGFCQANNIWVDKHGNRYVNEMLGFGRHGWEVREHTHLFNGTEGDFLRIPTWAIFDEAARLKGPFVTGAVKAGWFQWHSGYAWSKDNSVEIAKGWITKGDTIAELAAKIAADPDNANPVGQPTMDPTGATLQAAIDKYNGYCAAKNDPEFGRPAANLVALNTPPFYAVKIWPVQVNTQGGPKRNASCRVLDLDGNPIPRLYGVGECGSFWAWMYQGGGNLDECMLTGRIAGKNAVAEKPWS
jgi:3-oxosteroid 1-dehydrogenase